MFEGILEDVVDTGAALNSHMTEDWRSRGHCNTFSFSTPILAQFLINELAWGEGSTAPICSALGKGVAFFCLDEYPRQMDMSKIFFGMVQVLLCQIVLCGHPV